MLIPPHGAILGGKLPPQNFDFPPSIISDGGEGTCFPPKMVAKKSNIFLLPPLGEGEITENAQFFALPPHNGSTKSQNFLPPPPKKFFFSDLGGGNDPDF